MKKIVGRVLAVLTAAVLLVTTTGCGTRVEEESVWIEGDSSVQTVTHSSGTKDTGSKSDDKVTTDSDGKTNVESIDTTKDDKNNLKGATVVIGYYRSDDGGKPNPSAPTYQDEIKLISDIEKKYNCKIKYKTVGNAMEYYGAWTAAAQAGTKFCDILQISTAVVLPAHFRAGYLTNLDKYLDTDSVIYNKRAMEQTKFKGKHYITVMSNRLYDPFGMYFNRKVFETFGVDTPDVYVKKNQWDWNKFVELAKATTGTKGGVQYYGYCSDFGNVDAWAISNGANMVVKNKKGKYVSNVTSKGYIKAIQHAYDLYNTHKVMGGVWEDGTAAMVMGRPNFGAGYMEALGSKNVGFTYIPKGPDVSTYNATVDETTAWGIPATVKNPEVMAKIMYDLTYPYKWRQTLEQQQESNFGDAASLQNAMDLIVKANENISLEPLYSYIRRLKLTDFGFKSQTSPRVFAASVEGEIQAEVDEFWAQ